MTVTRAREILGKKYAYLTDDQVKRYIKELGHIAKIAADQTIERYSLPTGEYEGSNISKNLG